MKGAVLFLSFRSFSPFEFVVCNSYASKLDVVLTVFCDPCFETFILAFFFLLISSLLLLFSFAIFN